MKINKEEAESKLQEEQKKLQKILSQIKSEDKDSSGDEWENIESKKNKILDSTIKLAADRTNIDQSISEVKKSYEDILTKVYRAGARARRAKELILKKSGVKLDV